MHKPETSYIAFLSKVIQVHVRKPVSMLVLVWEPLIENLCAKKDSPYESINKLFFLWLFKFYALTLFLKRRLYFNFWLQTKTTSSSAKSFGYIRLPVSSRRRRLIWDGQIWNFWIIKLGDISVMLVSLRLLCGSTDSLVCSTICTDLKWKYPVPNIALGTTKVWKTGFATKRLKLFICLSSGSLNVFWSVFLSMYESPLTCTGL